MVEKERAALAIEEYVFTQSTLEQVFLCFAREQEVADDQESATPSANELAGVTIESSSA